MKVKTNKVWAISSLSCGILGLLLFLMPYFGLPLGIIAIIFYTKQKESAMAKAGLVTGIIGIVINAVMICLLLLALIFATTFNSL